jgi:hypothetical protein
LIDPLGLLNIGDVVSSGITVMTTVAKAGGLITVGTAQAIGAISTILGVFTFPGELNAYEDLALREIETDIEIQQLEGEIKEIQRQLAPMLDKLNIEYDWNISGPC